MILEVQIRLTSHWLGDQRPDNAGIRRFKKRSVRKDLEVDQEQWYTAIQKAVYHLNLVINVKGTLQPPAGIVFPTLRVYQRRYSRVKVDTFEMISSGTILTFHLLLFPDKPKAPSLEELKQIIGWIGSYEGLSPWGSKFGYGRFTLVGITLPDPMNIKF